MRRIAAISREAFASVWSQPVASTITVLVIAGMIVAVMLTTGRTVGAEQQVLGSIDSAGTRSIVIRAEADAGLTADVLTRLDSVEGIEWAAAFSSAVDATNTSIPDGTRVPVRLAYSRHLERLGVPADSPLPGGLAYASSESLQQLGLPESAGSVTTTDGVSYGVAGRLQAPDFLQALQPLTLVPQQTFSGTESVQILMVIAARPDLVAPVADAVLSLVAVDDPTKISVETSEGIAQLRALIQGQLGSFARGLVLIMLAITGALVAVILYGLVMMRRRDFGRRRALGATRSMIVGLLLTQTAILSFGGVLVGSSVAAMALSVAADPLPDTRFFAAVAVLAIATALLAALVPAIAASRREPIKELRVP